MLTAVNCTVIFDVKIITSLIRTLFVLNVRWHRFLLEKVLGDGANGSICGPFMSLLRFLTTEDVG